MHQSLIPLVYRMLHDALLQKCRIYSWSPLPKDHVVVHACSTALETVQVLWIRKDEVQLGDVQ